MPENLKYILTLTIICLVTASLLTGVYLLTRPKIIAPKEKAEQQALEEVIPEAGYFEPVMRQGKISHFRAYLSSRKRRMFWKTIGKRILASFLPGVQLAPGV